MLCKQLSREYVTLNISPRILEKGKKKREVFLEPERVLYILNK